MVATRRGIWRAVAVAGVMVVASGGIASGATAARTAASGPGAAAASAAAPGPCSEPAGRPWCDATRSPDERAQLLLDALTPDERISLLAGSDTNGHTGSTAAVPRIGLPHSYVTDGPVGIRQGPATAMPTPMALAATFDPALARLYGTVLGDEARAKGNDGLLAPTINLMRTPLNGRTFEAFGEDPYLVARTAVAWIRGAQSQGVYATPKHFAANNQEGRDLTGVTGNPGSPLGGAQQNTRYMENSVLDERTLHETYLPAFEAAIREAGAGSIMCSYNRLNGPWACSSHELLDDILKQRWGFKGFVMSDWVMATHPFDTVPALNNGLDLEMPFPDAYLPLSVRLALTTGQASQASVDDHVRRLLRTLFAFGFFDRPTPVPDDGLIDRAAHAAAAQRIEESAITLLRNHDNMLPLDTDHINKLAVIGPFADRFVTGGGSGNVTPFERVTVLQGIRDRAGPRIAIDYADGSDPAQAAAAARDADAAVVVVGDYQTEGTDKSCLTLECPDAFGDQDGLIATVAAAQPRTAVVLQTGGPVLTPWRHDVAALLEAWYPGQAGGRAVARVLFGDADPGGRLPATFPEREADLPTAGDERRYPGTATGDVHYDEGVLVGYRWYDARGIRPAYPFGHGRSYTRWRYGRLRVRRRADGTARVSFTITNAGRRAGTDVAQLYLGIPSSAGPGQPPRRLAAYRRVRLKAGAHRRVTLPVTRRALSSWDATQHDWVVAQGCVRVLVGRSSRAIVRRATLPAGGATCR